MEENKKIVVIGGGTGVYTVLTSLKKYPLEISAIVSMADDGGSTGILRDEFGVLPPGDIRRSLVALSNSEKIMRDLFVYRFPKGKGLKGHSLGNLLLTALEEITGGFDKAIIEAGKILAIKGKVIPVTLDNVCLYARLENDEIIKGETNIDVPKHDGNLRIMEVWLSPEAHAYSEALLAIKEADLIIIGPGDLYSSIVANLLVTNIPQAITESKAKKIYMVNIMTKFGETNNFRTSDFVAVIEQYLGKNVLDYVVYNTERPREELLRSYAEENAHLVEVDEKKLKRRSFKFIGAPFLSYAHLARHDHQNLVHFLLSLI